MYLWEVLKNNYEKDEFKDFKDLNSYDKLFQKAHRYIKSGEDIELIGYNCDYYIPSRYIDGYGINEKNVESINPHFTDNYNNVSF